MNEEEKLKAKLLRLEESIRCNQLLLAWVTPLRQSEIKKTLEKQIKRYTKLYNQWEPLYDARIERENEV